MWNLLHSILHIDKIPPCTSVYPVVESFLTTGCAEVHGGNQSMPDFPNTSCDSLILFHHIRAVCTITDTIPVPCENHSQIA